MRSTYSLKDYSNLTQRVSQNQEVLAPGPSLTTCLIQRVAGPKPPEPNAPPSRTTVQPTRSRENREISRYEPTGVSRVSSKTTWRYRKTSSSGVKKCFINGLKNVYNRERAGSLFRIAFLISPSIKEKWQTTLKSMLTGYTIKTAFPSLSQPVTWKQILPEPITWAATDERASVALPAPLIAQTRARAPLPHVGASPSQPLPSPAHPPPNTGLQIRVPEPNVSWVPSSSPIYPPPLLVLTTCPERPLTFLAGLVAAGHSGRCRRRGRCPPPPQQLLG